jgi:hypothetical protein
MVQGRSVAQAASRWSPTAGGRAQLQASQFGIYGHCNKFLSKHFGFPRSELFQNCSILIHSSINGAIL